MNTLNVRAKSAGRACRPTIEPAGRRWGLLPSLCFWAAVVAAVAAGNTALANPPTVTRVEEDRVVEMGGPDPNTNAAQIDLAATDSTERVVHEHRSESN